MDITGIGEVADLAKSVVNKIWPDKTEEEKAQIASQMQVAMNDYNLAQGQINTNIEEAKSVNWFVAGWRPFLGWVGGISVGYHFLVFPLFSTYIGMKDIDSSTLFQLITGMLGLGIMRTYEKKTASESNR